MNPVVHFEMPYDDSARMAGFHAAAFGRQMPALGAGMGGCVTAATGATCATGATGATGADGRPGLPGASMAAAARASPIGRPRG